jgi:hypothetical protein
MYTMTPLLGISMSEPELHGLAIISDPIPHRSMRVSR